MNATNIMQLLVNGLALGFIYALVGIEYTLVWNSTGLLNFSHDKFIQLGAYIFAGSCILEWPFSPVVAVITTLLIMFIFGVLVAYGIFNPLRNMESRLFAIVGTVILGRIVQEVCRMIWGPETFTYTGFLRGTFQFGDLVIAKCYVYIIVIAVAIVVLLELLFKTTKVGRAIRCVAQNKMASELMGINVKANIAATIGLSGVICGIIGILVIPQFNVSLTMASMIGLKGFTAGVIGGFGNIPGAIIGGLLLGVVENASVLAIPTIYKDCVSFVFLILFLLVKPNGLMGSKR